MLGLRTTLEEAAVRLVESTSRVFDLGLLGDQLFANASAGGFLAEASEATTTEAKNLAGRFAYLVAGSRALVDHEPVQVELRARTPHGTFEWRGLLEMFAVCNAPTAGGGQPLAPEARWDDGWLDAFVVEPAPALGSTAIGLAKVLLEISGGVHASDEHVLAFRVDELDLSFARPTHVNVDGEVQQVEHARYRVLPGVTRILAPE